MAQFPDVQKAVDAVQEILTSEYGSHVRKSHYLLLSIHSLLEFSSPYRVYRTPRLPNDVLHLLFRDSSTLTQTPSRRFALLQNTRIEYREETWEFEI